MSKYNSMQHVGVLGMHWGHRKSGANREAIKSRRGKPIIVKGNNRFNRTINKNPSKSELKRVHDKNNPISTKARKGTKAVGKIINKKWNSLSSGQRQAGRVAVMSALVMAGGKLARSAMDGNKKAKAVQNGLDFVVGQALRGNISFFKE